jgi:hypothetical protein
MEEWVALDAEPDDYDAQDSVGDTLEDDLDGLPVDRLDDWPSHVPGDWNTIPFGSPGECRRRLLVVIDRDAMVVQRLRETRAHLAKCPDTTSVMFYLTGFFSSWQGAWIANRGALEVALGSQRPGQPPIIRISVRGRRQHTFFTSEGRPAGGRLMLDWWRSANPHLRWCLRRRLEFLRDHNVEQARHCGFIGGYTEQPLGLDGQNVLSFGDYRATGANIQAWRLRAYLVPGVPVGFAGRIKLPVTPDCFEPPVLPGDENGAWVAVDADRFLTRPEDYIDLALLP